MGFGCGGDGSFEGGFSRVLSGLKKWTESRERVLELARVGTTKERRSVSKGMRRRNGVFCDAERI